MPVTSVLIDVHQDTQTLLLNQAKVCKSANPILQTLFVTLHPAEQFLPSISAQKPERPGVLGSKTKQHLHPWSANDPQFVWPFRGLDLTLASAGRFLHLCCFQLQRLQLCIQEWYHGFLALWLKSEQIRGIASAKTQRLVFFSMAQWLNHQSASKYPSRWTGMDRRGNDTWTPLAVADGVWRLFFSIFHFWILLKGVRLSDDNREDTCKISDGRRESAVRLLPLVLLSLLQPGWGLIEAAESLTSRRTQEQILR